MNGRYVLVGLVAALVSFRIFAADSMSGKDIGERLIGSWIVPPDSTDFNAQDGYVMESFRPDGTYTLSVFRDANCQILVQQIPAKWTIEGHVLISTLPNGKKLRDEVVGIDREKLTLHSLDDGTTYTRARALSCSKPQVS